MKTKIILITLLIALGVAFASHADIPHVISFQGKATDTQGMPLDGAYALTFRIYNHAALGDPDAAGDPYRKWKEEHSNVTITKGAFQVLLGSQAEGGLDLPFDEDYWVSIEINSDGEMFPRTRLASAGYAYKASSLVKDPAIPFYKKGFEVEYLDSDNIRIAPGVMDVAGKMFTATAYSNALALLSEANWIHGFGGGNTYVYVYAYDKGGAIDFKFSDEKPDLSDHLGNAEKKPLLYREYNGAYYRYIGSIKLIADNTIDKVKSVSDAEVSSIFSTFGGSGKDGDITVADDTNFSYLTKSVDNYYLEANNLTIDAGKTITVDTGWAYIGVKGTCAINGTISADGKGELGGDEISGSHQLGKAGLNANGEVSRDEAQYAVSGAGGGGGSGGADVYSNCFGGNGGGAGGAGGNGGGAGNGGYGSDGISTAYSKSISLTREFGADLNRGYSPFIFYILKYRGTGGGGGGTYWGVGGAGGNGGGVIYIECEKLIFDGVLTAKGDDGNPARGGYLGTNHAGGGGGGGGGVILVRAKATSDNPTGTVNISGGAGGAPVRNDPNSGRPGGVGADGFKSITEVW